MSEIKIGNIQLTNWTKARDNLWRFDKNKYGVDGLNIDRVGFVLNSHVVDLNDGKWIIYFEGNLHYLKEIFLKTNSKYKNRDIKYEELEEYKNMIDEFLIKTNKLLMFI